MGSKSDQVMAVSVSVIGDGCLFLFDWWMFFLLKTIIFRLVWQKKEPKKNINLEVIIV